MSKVILLHEMHENMQIPTDHVLTFDDGLYTQYRHGKNLPNKRIFFISTKFICKRNQSTEFIHCADAHEKAFRGNFENYMTINQIKELIDSGAEIGGHSHAHANLDQFSATPQKTKHIIDDTEMMLEWFGDHLGFLPTSFAFPYNNDCNRFYRMILEQKYGVTKFYGSERITLDEIPV